MAVVQIRGLTKSYGTVQVMHGIDFDVADAEFVALVGPSGCGKSTLLRMIAGLEDISGGTISIGGRVVNEVEPKERDIAMVFQNYALYPHMTVRQNMGFSLRLRGGARDDINRAVTHAADILGLTAYLERSPKQLSGGQRQRVAMGRAIVRNPAVFLFDEPLSNLDAALRVQMRAEIRGLHERLGSTSIFVTHDQVEAMTMADRIVVMREGRLEQAGKPLDLYDRPMNAFVAGFIGSPAMNLLPGHADAGAVHLGPDLTVKVETQAQGPVLFGIRPEHLDLVPNGTQGAITAQISGIESTGTAMLLSARAGPHNLNALFMDRPPVQRGDQITLRPRPGYAHLFDAKTLLRLP